MRPDTMCRDHVPATAPIPELIVCPDHMQVFMFSAATWNRHHIHYSKDAAISEGLPDIVVQRALIGNFFARLITNWIGDSGELRRLAWKVTHSALPGRPIVCRGRVARREKAEDGYALVCEVTAHNENDKLIASGEAVVAFAAEARSD